VDGKKAPALVVMRYLEIPRPSLSFHPERSEG
jgi:hypothetical protein